MAHRKQRVVLRFPSDSAGEPITYVLIKEYDVMINILNADISHGREGNLLVEISGEKESLEGALSYLNSKRVEVLPVVKTILFKQEECIHCGACTSVCYPGALIMDLESRELRFSPEECVACELCIKACPLQLFELNFGVN
jgi:ferredoxin